MFKPFEHSGFWWDARDPHTRWPGTLSFDPVNGAVLARTLPTDLVRAFGERATFTLIHGETASGTPVTLINCFERGSSDIFANEVITGFHADSQDPLIATATAVIENMSEWWAPAAIAHDPARQFPDIGVSYQKPPHSTCTSTMPSARRSARARANHSGVGACRLKRRYASRLRRHRRGP
jgi:hypothetical protein